MLENIDKITRIYLNPLLTVNRNEKADTGSTKALGSQDV